VVHAQLSTQNAWCLTTRSSPTPLALRARGSLVRCAHSARLSAGVGPQEEMTQHFLFKDTTLAHQRQIVARQARSAVSFAQFFIAKERL